MQLDDSGDSPVAIVTGGTQGIGRAIARRLAAIGMQVVVCSRSDHGENPTADVAATYRCDVRNPQDVRNTVSRTIESFGRIDVLVNSAGVSMPDERPIEEIDDELWSRIMRTNVDGTFFFCREVMNEMRRRNSGEIVNILSTASFGSKGGIVPYPSSKFAARAITEALQQETKGTGVRVSAVAPGPVATSIWDHKSRFVDEAERSRMLRPDDIAEIVEFLITRPSYVRIGTITVTPDFA